LFEVGNNEEDADRLAVPVTGGVNGVAPAVFRSIAVTRDDLGALLVVCDDENEAGFVVTTACELEDDVGDNATLLLLPRLAESCRDWLPRTADCRG
jgi:hypothetical protein